MLSARHHTILQMINTKFLEGNFVVSTPELRGDSVIISEIKNHLNSSPSPLRHLSIVGYNCHLMQAVSLFANNKS